MVEKLEWEKQPGLNTLQQTLPVQSWWDHLHKHEEEIAIMGISWDWPMCRWWSEQVFKMVSNNRLRDGWEDGEAIKDIQSNVCRDAPRPVAGRSVVYIENTRAPINPTPSTSTTSSQGPLNPHEDFCKETDGRAC